MSGRTSFTRWAPPRSAPCYAILCPHSAFRALMSPLAFKCADFLYRKPFVSPACEPLRLLGVSGAPHVRVIGVRLFFLELGPSVKTNIRNIVASHDALFLLVQVVDQIPTCRPISGKLLPSRPRYHTGGLSAGLSQETGDEATGRHEAFRTCKDVVVFPLPWPQLF